MAAKESTFGNMVLSLSIICLVCAALLGCVYSVTKAPIDKANLDKVNNAIAAVVPEGFDNIPSQDMFTAGDAVIYPATKAGEPLGYAVKVSVSGFGGPLQMMVGFTPDGTIFNTSIISLSETPGLGAKISDENIQPRVQVRGKNPETTNLKVSKDGGDIDAITASTITSRAFLKGVEASYQAFKSIQTSNQPEITFEEFEEEEVEIEIGDKQKEQ